MDQLMDIFWGLFPFLMVAAFFYIKLRPVFRRAPEGEIEKTVLARLSAPRMGQFDPMDLLNRNSVADQTLGETILRPSAPLRLLSIGLTALAFAFLFTDFGAEVRVGMPDWLIHGIAALVLYALVLVQTAETRFDRDVIIGRGPLFQRIEKRWTDLVRIQDDGQHYYILRFTDGSKLSVQKHAKGIGEFVHYAKRRLAANLRGEAMPQPKIRPGTSVFGDKKTFY